MADHGGASDFDLFLERYQRHTKHTNFMRYLNMLSLRENIYCFDMRRTMFSKVFRRIDLGGHRFDRMLEISILIYNAYITVQFRAFSAYRNILQSDARLQLVKLGLELPVFISDKKFAVGVFNMAFLRHWDKVNHLLKFRCAGRSLCRYRNGTGHSILMVIMEVSRIGEGFESFEHQRAFETCLFFSTRSLMLNAKTLDEDIFFERTCEVTVLNSIIKVKNLLALKMVLSIPNARESIRYCDRSGRNILIQAIIEEWFDGFKEMLRHPVVRDIVNRDAVLHFAAAHATPDLFRYLLDWAPEYMVMRKKSLSLGNEPMFLNDVNLAEAAAGASNRDNLEILFQSKHAPVFLMADQSCSCISALGEDMKTTCYIMQKENEYMSSAGEQALGTHRWTSFHTIAEIHRNFPPREVAVVFLCLTHNLEAMKQVLTREPHNGETWFHVSIRNRCQAMNKGLWYLPNPVIKELICARDFKGRTPLHYAILHSDQLLAKKLISYLRQTPWGISSMLKLDQNGNTFIHYEAEGASTTLIPHVFQSKRMHFRKDLFGACNRDGNTVFHLAATHSTLSPVKLLILYKGLICAYSDDVQMLEFDRLSHIRNNMGRTWLHEAAAAGNVRSLNFWLRCVKGTLAKGALKCIYSLAHVKDQDDRNFVEVALLNRQFEFFTHVLRKDIAGYLSLEALWADTSCHLLSVLSVLCSETHGKVVGMLSANHVPDYLAKLLSPPQPF